MKDKVDNIIQAVKVKEDEIYTVINEDHGLELLKHYDSDGVSIKNQLKSLYNNDFNREFAVENLKVIDEKLKEIPALETYKTQLVALVDVQVSAYDQLVQLQQSYVDNVEDDPATR